VEKLKEFRKTGLKSRHITLIESILGELFFWNSLNLTKAKNLHKKSLPQVNYWVKPRRLNQTEKKSWVKAKTVKSCPRKSR
jgi:hypothetical protein